MGNRHRSQGIRVKDAVIKAHRRECDTAVMCRLLDVSRSGCYDWLRKPPSDRACEDQRWLGLIRAAYTASVDGDTLGLGSHRKGDEIRAAYPVAILAAPR